MNRQELSQLELSSIVAFLEVAERGSFTEAAIALNLSQPTVSQQIQRLEKFVGMQLLKRKFGGVSLTDEGEIFIKYCRTCFYSLGSGIKAIAQFSETITGKLTLGLTTSAAQRYLADVLPAYCRQHPGVTVKIIEDYLNELVDGLQKQMIDVAVLSLPIPTEYFEIEILYEEPLVLTVGATHPLVTERVTWEVLSRQAILLPRQRSDFGIRYIIEELYRSHYCQMRVAAEVSGFAALRQLLLSNLGVAFLPQSLVRKDVYEGKFVIKELADVHLLHKVALVAHRERQPNLAVEKLIDAIRVHAEKVSHPAAVPETANVYNRCHEN